LTQVSTMSPLHVVDDGVEARRFLRQEGHCAPARSPLESRGAFVEYNDRRGVPVLAAPRYAPLTQSAMGRKSDRVKAGSGGGRVESAQVLGAMP